MNLIKWILIFFLPLSLNAQEIKDIPLSLRGFDGGINENSPSIALKQNESPNALNVQIDNPPGSLKTREGSIVCGSLPSANAATEMYEYIKSNGVRYLIVTDNQNYYQTIDCVNFTTIVTGLSSYYKPTFTTARDNLWVVNKSTSTFIWNGASRTILDGNGTTPNVPKGTYITFWKERVWIARTDDEPSAVYFSALTDTVGTAITPDNASAWPATNAIQVDQNGGSPIYGIRAYRDSLYVFKDNGIFRIIFNNERDIYVTKTLSSVGCRFQQSIVELDNMLYFVGPDGIYKFDGDKSERISDNIINTFNNIKQPAYYESYKLWTTYADFSFGSVSNTDITNSQGDVILKFSTGTRTEDAFTDNNYSSNPTWTFSYGQNHFTAAGGYLAYSVPWTINLSTAHSGWIYETPNKMYPYGEYTYTDALHTNLEQYYNGTSGIWQCQNIKEQQDFYFNTDATSLANGTKGYFIRREIVIVPTGVKGCRCGYNESCSVASYIYVMKRIPSGEQVMGYSTCGTRLVDKPSTENTDKAITSYDTRSTIHAVVTSTAIIAWGVASDASHQACTVLTVPITEQPISLSNLVVGAYVNSTYNDISDGFTESGRITGLPGIDNITISSGGYTDSGSFTSEVYNSVTVSTWGTLGTDYTTNGGYISFYVRAGTNSASCQNASWQGIATGSKLPFVSTNTYVQWYTSLTRGSDNTLSPVLHGLNYNWYTGLVSAQPVYGITFKNRYLLSVSTSLSNSYNDVFLVKSRYPSENWIFYDWDIGAMSKYNDELYAGSANSAYIYKLFQGTNDNGTAINAYWETGDYGWNDLSRKKSLNSIYYYYKPTATATSMNISYSLNGGQAYTAIPLNFSGTTPFGLGIKKFNGGNANAFRFKISNTTLDQPFEFYGMDAYAKPYLFLE